MKKFLLPGSCRQSSARWGRVTILLLHGLLAGAFTYQARPQTPAPIQRVANATLKMPQTPQAWGYKMVQGLGALTFSNPVALRSPVGDTNRLFVVEQTGRVFVITNLSAPTKTLYLDLSSRVVVGQDYGLFTLAFHPGYETNGFFFVGYHLNAQTPDGTGLHFRVSRFSVSPQNPNIVVTNTELPLITQHVLSSGTGFATSNDLLFGPEGYLYIAIGNSGDPGATSQAIDSNFFAGILRIDIDKKPGNLMPNPHTAVTTNYAIPSDNPFVGATNFNGTPVDPAKVRTEYYAVGLRNPWRMAFDPPTGLLYVGDPGTTLHDEIDVVVKGGNYGWPYREGAHPGPKASKTPPGFSSINPIYENPTGALIGGLVYRGNNYAQLQGQYIFGDWVTAQISALRFAGTNLVPAQKLSTQSGVVAFGLDPSNGDVLVANHEGGRIMRLTYSTNLVGTPLPLTLADTGAFADVATLTPQPGVVAYDVNVPFWSDNAEKARWFSIPNLTQTIAFSRETPWLFPTGTVWIKHFELEITNGSPASARRIETRFLVRNAAGVYGVTYRWDDSQTNATLVGPEGLDQEYEINDGGIIRKQIWHYPSRSECLVCHTPLSGYALGFNTPQMNRPFDYDGVAQNQIRTLSDAGYFTRPVTNVHTLPALAGATNSAYSLDYRIHSYLAANCVQCHQPGGAGRALFDARLVVPLSAGGVINGALLNQLDDSENRVIKPGSLEHSVLLTRLANLGPNHMPPLATSVLNQEAIDLFQSWINGSATNYLSYGDWQKVHFGSAGAQGSAPAEDADGDGASNELEFLTGTDPLAPGGAWGIRLEISGAEAKIQVPRIANRGFEVQWSTNLFNPASWQPLDVPGNEPVIAPTDSRAILQDTLTDASAVFYRVRIFEP